MTITFVRRSAYCLAVLLLTLSGIVLITKMDNALQLALVVFVGMLAIAVPFLAVSLTRQAEVGLLHAALDAVDHAIILVSGAGRVIYANHHVLTIVQIDPRALRQKRIQQLFDDQDLAIATKLGLKLAEWQQISERPPTNQENPTRYQLGAHTLERQIVALPTGELLITIKLVALSATAASSSTESLTSVEAQMDIANMIVHDLRSPLNSLNVSMDLLREMATEPTLSGTMVEQTTALAQRALRKLLNLVNSLLDLAKLESGTMVLDLETVSLHPIVDQVIAELMPIANEMTVTIVVDMPLMLPFVRIDSDQIERVLSNLLENGIKFAPPETSIVIRARVQPDNLLRVEVIDQGMGVPDTQKTRIFERYFQGDQTHIMRRGTGLGLTFCQLAVQAHGGTIWVEDNPPPSTGSIFIFTLPIGTHESD